jgi:hypothetical protein
MAVLEANKRRFSGFIVGTLCFVNRFKSIMYMAFIDCVPMASGVPMAALFPWAHTNGKGGKSWR